MAIDRDSVVFFDAACLVATAGSPSGGSGFLLSVCSRGFFKGAVSQAVLFEAERNILAKLRADARDAYGHLVGMAPLTVVTTAVDESSRYEPIVGEKDGHVVAAALAARASFLLALDKLLAARVNRVNLAVRALSPGEFINLVLPDHVDYASIR